MYGLLQVETNSILYQSRRNVWNKKSIYTLNLVPELMEQLRNVIKVHTSVKNVENVDVGWCVGCVVCLCVWCLWVCVVCGVLCVWCVGVLCVGCVCGV